MDKTNNIDKIKLYKKQWAEINRQKTVEAKRRFYEKMKLNPEFMENIRQKAKERYRIQKGIEYISEENKKSSKIDDENKKSSKTDEKKKPRGRPRIYP